MTSLNEEEKKWLSVGIILSLLLIVFVVVYYFAFYSPNINRLETQERRIRNNIEELEAEEKQLTEFLEITKDRKIQELEEAIAQFSEVLPTETEVAGLLELLDDMLALSNLYYTSIRPLASIDHNMYTEIPFRMNIEGGYWELIHFIDLLENAPRFIRVKNLDINSKMRYSTRLTLEERIADMFRDRPEEDLDALTLIQDRIRRGQTISRDERIQSLLGIPLKHDIVLDISTYILREREGT